MTFKKHENDGKNNFIIDEPSPSSEKQKTVDFIPEDAKFTLDGLVLPAYTKEALMDVIDYANNSQLVFETWGLERTHRYSKRLGINLYGLPGTGKTMAAHAIAAYLGRKILVVNYADLESKYVGETPKNIRRAFKAAQDSNAIIFFDEADAILSKRVTDMKSASDVSVNQTRSVLLMLLNDYQDFIIFATNFIENFDSAFMRRISHHIKFDLPDLDCRKRLWRMYIPETMPNDIDIDALAAKYDGISGSDISSAVLSAAFAAARRKDKLVSNSYIYKAVENILESKKANERKSVKVTERVVSDEYARKQMNKFGGEE